MQGCFVTGTIAGEGAAKWIAKAPSAVTALPARNEHESTRNLRLAIPLLTLKLRQSAASMVVAKR